MAAKIWATAVTVGVLIAGCAATEPAPPPSSTASSRSTGPTKELVAWVDAVCQVEQASLWNPPPPVDATAVTEADRQAVVAYLAQGRDHFTQLTAQIDGIGATPVDGGDDVTANLRSKIGGLADRFEQWVQVASTSQEIGAPYRLALATIASWTIGSPSLEELAQREPQVAQAKKQVC